MKNRHIKEEKNKGSTHIRPPENYIAKSTNDLHPAFCFRYMDNQYSLAECDKDTKALFSDKLEEVGRLTWQEIQNASRKGKGHEKISYDSLKYKPKKTPEDRDFLSFRLGNGKNSIFLRYRKDKIFYIVFIDPNGETYSHGS